MKISKKKSQFLKALFGLFLIVLVVSLSVVPSLTYALVITEANATGMHKIPSITKDKTGDQVTFSLRLFQTLLPSEPPVKPEYFRIVIDTYGIDAPFSQACESSYCNLVQDDLQGKVYECVCVANFAPDDPLSAKIVYAYSPTTTFTKEISLYPDTKKPSIEQASLKQHQDGLLLTYAIKDEACNGPGCGEVCAGVKTIKLFDEEGPVFTKTFDDLRCFQQGQFIIPYQKEGDHKFYIDIYDGVWDNYADNAHHALIHYPLGSLLLDYTNATIEKTFTFLVDGQPLTYMPTIGKQEGTLEVHFYEDHPQKVQAYLSDIGNQDIELSFTKINGRYAASQDNAYCYQKNILANEIVCSFPLIQLVGKDDLTYSFRFRVTDTQGNTREEEITKTFQKDDTSPVVITFTNQQQLEDEEGRMWIKKQQNVLVATIEEAESGINATGLFLDATVLDYQQPLQADNCTKTSEQQWQCFWQVDNTKERLMGTLYLLPISHDRVNNPLTGNLRKKFRYDNRPPSVLDGTAYALTNQGLLPYIKVGDKVLFQFNVTENESGLFQAFLNLSTLYDGDEDYGKLPVSCEEKEEHHYTCTYTTDELPLNRFLDTEVIFTVYDNAENKATFSLPIRVYKISDDAPDCFYLDLKAEQIAPIEKTILESLTGMPYFLYVPFELIGDRCGDDLRLEQLYVECNGAKVDYAKIPTSSGIVYGGYLVFAYNPSDLLNLNTDYLTVGVDEPCKIGFYDIYNYYVHTVPEEEEVAFRVPLVRNLETPDEVVKEEIGNILHDYSDAQRTWKSVSHLLNVMSQICSIGNIFGRLWNNLNNVNVALCVLNKIPVVNSIVEPLRQGIIVPLQTLIGKINDLIFKPIAAIPCAISQCKGKYMNVKVLGKEIPIVPGGVLTLVSQLYREKLKATKIDLPLTQAETPIEIGDLVRNIPDELELAKMSPSLAWAGLCLPAIIYHTRKDVEFNCMRGLCYLNAVQNGFPKTTCDDLYQYITCTTGWNWWNFFAELFGVKALMEQALRLLGNPLAAAYIGAKLLIGSTCDLDLKEPATCGQLNPNVGCLLYYSLNAIEGSLASYQGFKTLIDQVQSVGKSGNSEIPNYCDQLKEKYDSFKREDEGEEA